MACVRRQPEEEGKDRRFHAEGHRNNIASVVTSPGWATAGSFTARSAIFRVPTTPYRMPTAARKMAEDIRLNVTI